MKVDLFSIGHFTVHTYGVMIAIGVILCVVMGYYRAKRMEMKAESVVDLAILCVVMGVPWSKSVFCDFELETVFNRSVECTWIFRIRGIRRHYLRCGISLDLL